MIPFIKKQPNVNLEFLVCRLLERASAQNSGGLTENKRLEDITSATSVARQVLIYVPTSSVALVTNMLGTLL